jgi:hypothetical protein
MTIAHTVDAGEGREHPAGRRIAKPRNVHRKIGTIRPMCSVRKALQVGP